MKISQAVQSESASIVVKTSSWCSTFSSSDTIHRNSSKLGLFGSIVAAIWVKKYSLIVERSGDDLGY